MKIYEAGVAMSKRWISICVFLVSAPLWAQNSLTLSEAWDIALENNISLQLQEKAIRQAQKEVSAQKTGYLPSFSAMATFNYQSELPTLVLPFSLPGVQSGIKIGVEDQYDLGVAVNQPIFTGFRTTNLVKAARETEQAQTIQKTSAKNQLLLQSGMLYYDLQLNLTQQAVLQEAIQRVDYHLQQVRNFYFAAQAAAFDTLEAANRKLLYQSQLQNLKNVYRVQLTKFRHVLNTGELVDVDRQSIENVDLSLAQLDGFLAAALRNRPELMQIMALQRAESYRAKSLSSAYFPQVYASASYHYARPGVNFFASNWMTFYTLGVGLQWEFWNWNRDRRRVEQSRLEYQKLDLQSQQLLLDVKQQVTEAYEMLQSTRDQILLQRRIVAQEHERYRITENTYVEGLATNLDLSTAETSLIDAELQLQQNYILWYQYRLQLDFATGGIGK